MNTNYIILTGRLTKDIEISFLPNENNTKKGTSTLAVSRNNKDINRQQADFFPLEMFGEIVEHYKKYIGKGSKVVVVGSMHIDTVKNEDGTWSSFSKVKVRSVEFVSNKEDINSETVSDNDFMNIPSNMEDELPFK